MQILRLLHECIKVREVLLSCYSPCHFAIILSLTADLQYYESLIHLYTHPFCIYSMCHLHCFLACWCVLFLMFCNRSTRWCCFGFPISNHLLWNLFLLCIDSLPFSICEKLAGSCYLHNKRCCYEKSTKLLTGNLCQTYAVWNLHTHLKQVHGNCTGLCQVLWVYCMTKFSCKKLCWYPCRM